LDPKGAGFKPSQWFVWGFGASIAEEMGRVASSFKAVSHVLP